MNRTMLALTVPALAAGALAATTLATGGPAEAAVSGPAFYIHGQVYRTVGTPTDFTGTGAPAWSFDTIYQFSGAQLNVAEAAPGDRDYNGGRWQVHLLQFPQGYAAAVSAGDLDGNGVLDTFEEVTAAIDAGAAVDAGIVKEFECTVNRIPGQ